MASSGPIGPILSDSLLDVMCIGVILLLLGYYLDAEAAHKKYQQFRPEQIWGDSGSVDAAYGEPAVRVYTCLGARIKDLTTEEEKSVAGVGELTGVYVIEVPKDSAAARADIVAGEAILAVNSRKVANAAALVKRLKRAKGSIIELNVVGAKNHKIKLEIE